MSQLVEIFEEVVLPRFHRVVVARFASRFFVLRGHRDRPRFEWQVEGPYATHEMARDHAIKTQVAAYKQQEATS